MSRGKRTLSPEESDLWKQVRRTVKPLVPETLERDIEEWIDHPGDAAPTVKARLLPDPARNATPVMPPYVPPMSKPGDNRPTASLDENTIRKIRKGRIEIDSRVDLHGMTELAAHGRLLEFLRRCQQEEARIVLVITGKGKGGSGVLRRAVPLWFAESAFRNVIGGWRTANPAHGGDGALYVRLRRLAGRSR